MNIVFRVDAHLWMGLGHLMRCVALAERLSDLGSNVHFICRPGAHKLYSQVEEKGYQLHLLPKLEMMPRDNAPENETDWLIASADHDARDTLDVLSVIGDVDWMIVDHYGIEARWEKMLSNAVSALAVISDIPNEQHSCHLLIDQTMGRLPQEYLGKVNSSATLLLGGDFSLLRPTFRSARELSVSTDINQKVVNILIFLGGGDGDAIAVECLHSITNSNLASDDRKLKIIVVSSNIDNIVFENRSNNNVEVNFSGFVRDFEDLLLSVDLAIGAPGGSTWERCCLGVPSILIPFADNQRQVASVIDKTRCGIVVERENVSKLLPLEIDTLLSDEMAFRKRGQLAIDGLGAARVAQYFLPEYARDDLPVTLKKVTSEDVEQVYQWQLLPETRRYARNLSIPTLDEHTTWMNARLEDPMCIFHTIYHGDEAAGVVRLDWMRTKNYEISIYLISSKFRLGLGLSALKLIDRLLPFVTIHAQVLAENEASNKLFVSAGYALVEPEKYLRKSISLKDQHVR